MPETNVPAMDENGEQISYARGLKVRFLDLYPGDDSMILYYTTDGSSPSEAANENRMIYDGSDIVLNSSTTIQAVYAKRCGSCAGCTADPMGECETPSYGDIATFDYRIQRQSTGFVRQLRRVLWSVTANGKPKPLAGGRTGQLFTGFLWE